MKFSTKVRFAALAGLAVLVAATPATAMMIAPSPIPLRIARADVVITGKVIKIEDKAVDALSFPTAKEKSQYRIAVVKIDDPILNAKGIKEIRVGFMLPPPPPPPPPPGAPIRIGPKFRGVILAENEEVCLFLTKHFDADFYTMPAYFDAIKKANNNDFEKNVEEPIDAAESKLILETLRDGNWAQPKPGTTRNYMPQSTFFQLGLTKEDKWEVPQVMNANQVVEDAQAWLRDNAGTFRIKKFVAEEKKDKKD
jgi:hypothetical protein